MSGGGALCDICNRAASLRYCVNDDTALWACEAPACVEGISRAVFALERARKARGKDVVRRLTREVRAFLDALPEPPSAQESAVASLSEQVAGPKRPLIRLQPLCAAEVVEEDTTAVRDDWA